MTTTRRAVPRSARHLLVLHVSAVLVVGLGCGGAEEKARLAEQAEAKATAEIADGVRPLVARCEQLGMARNPPDAVKILVIDLKDGKRHRATDKLPQEQRGRSSDSDLLVFAVVSVREERLKGAYIDGTDGIQLTAKVVAVRWPKKEPVGFYTVQAPPPEGIMRKGETPRGDLNFYLARAIKEKHWPKSLSDKPEEFILGSWKQEYGTTAIDFTADGKCHITDPGRKREVGLDVFAKHDYNWKFVDRSTIDLELASKFYSRVHRGKKARISDLTNSSF